MGIKSNMTEHLIQVIGQNAYAKLQASESGQTLKVPATHSSKGFEYLCKIIGKTSAEALLKVFPGVEIYIANGRRAEASNGAAKRNASILAEYDKLTKTLSGSEAVRHLSTKHRLSNRWIYMILKRTW